MSALLSFRVFSAALAFAGGIFFMTYLVVSPTQMSWYLGLLTIVLMLLFLSVRRLPLGWAMAANVLVLLILFAAGYLSATWVYLSQSEERVLAPVTRDLSSAAEGHTAVLYFTHGEPPAYSAMPWIETFHELDKDGVSFVPWPFRPFFLTGIRQYYLESGGSPHNKIHQVMIQSLILSMPEAVQQGVRFYLGFLDSPPRPDELVIQAINEGASRLIVMPVFLTDSSHTVAGFEMVDEVEPEKYGVSVCKGNPLWNSDYLQQMFVDRADAHLGNVDKSEVGILLIGHGQPDDWDAIYPTQTEQELLFRQQVRERLVAAGYLSDHVKLAWMSFKPPQVASAAQELAALGIKRLLAFSASISADAIHSDIQVPTYIKDAKLPAEIEVVNMGAWGNSPLVIQAIRTRILECNPSLGDVQASATD